MDSKCGLQEALTPPPYEHSPGTSPYSLRCAEIDAAAMLIRDPSAFAEAAADLNSSAEQKYGFCEKPPKNFFAADGCPFYLSRLNFGSSAVVLCDAVRPHLHGYIQFKFCEGGRKVYCPIWRALNKRDVCENRHDPEAADV